MREYKATIIVFFSAHIANMSLIVSLVDDKLRTRNQMANSLVWTFDNDNIYPRPLGAFHKLRLHFLDFFDHVRPYTANKYDQITMEL